MKAVIATLFVLMSHHIYGEVCVDGSDVLLQECRSTRLQFLTVENEIVTNLLVVICDLVLRKLLLSLTSS